MKILYFLIIILSCNVLAEGKADHFKVKYVRVDKNGKGIVKFQKPLAGTPSSCGSSHNSDLAFNTNTEGGKAIFSIVLTAYTTGKKIQAYGTNNCDIYGVVESWNWGFIID